MCFEEQRPIANPNRNSEHWIPEEPIPGIALWVLDCRPTPGVGVPGLNSSSAVDNGMTLVGMHVTALGPGFFH